MQKKKKKDKSKSLSSNSTKPVWYKSLNQELKKTYGTLVLGADGVVLQAIFGKLMEWYGTLVIIQSLLNILSSTQRFYFLT